MEKPKAVKLREEFEKEFEKIGAGEIFKHLHLKNPDKFRKAVADFEGDESELKKWLRSYSVMRTEMKNLADRDTNG